MKSILLVVLAIPTSLLATGCPLAPGCGGFTGAGDMAYQRGTDMLIVCANGGYTATLGTATHEGMSANGVLTDGPTGAMASSLGYVNGSAIAFGDAAWTNVPLDEVALDHADSLCQDLQTRAWWNMTALPVDTTFARPADGFASLDDCVAAQEAGSYPAGASCQDQLDLCADGTSFVTLSTGTITGSYTDAAAELAISQFAGVSGFYGSDGSLQIGSGTAWSTKAVSPQAVSKCTK